VTALAVVAASWGVVMGIAPLLQARRMLETRSSRDVSLVFLGIYVFGFGFWLAYGASLGNAAIVIPNVVSLVVGTVTLAVAARFRFQQTSSSTV
jgi:MtN3 and saliva related transmembrane protein